MSGKGMTRWPAATSITSSVQGTVGDPVTEAVRRLRVLSLTIATVPALAIVALALIAPGGMGRASDRWLSIGLISAAMLTSLGVYFAAGSERLRPQTRLDIGFGYQVGLALIAGIFRHLTPWAPGDGFREVSQITLLTLLFAALVPNRPRRVFVASLLAAAMDPLGLWITIQRGNPTPPPAQMAGIFMSTFTGVVVSTIVSHVVYGLARSVDAARRLGSYELTEKLGSGGMGEVWRAQHRLLARPAAVKLIRPEAVGETNALKRFECEAQATAALHSPHTIHLYDFGISAEGTFYYVMELLDGLDIEHLVTRYGPQPAERVIHILRQVCHSLDEAHHRGLIHRDIKPANIYLCRYGREYDFVKVLDFGLVKAQHEDKTSSGVTLTREGTIAGTPAYVAPEVALGEATIDGRADLYALGCVGYWLLTGQLVFEAETSLKMVLKHVHEAPEAPSTRAEVDVPAALDHILLDCLAKDARARPANARDLADRLGAITLAEPWSRERAARWWEQHAPAATSA
jgi:eukaryotic-like serine/threonine-protein kinase